MKIDISPLQSTFPTTTKKESTQGSSETEKLPNPKQDLKEMVQNYVEEVQKSLNEKGDDNPKVQRIMGKFKFGKKLTPQEMAYIRKYAPGLVEQVNRVMREREIVERSMKIAPTKYHVHMVAFHSASLIEKQPSAEDRLVLANHLADVKKEYMESEEYKEKPSSPMEQEEKDKKNRKKHVKKQHKIPSNIVYTDVKPFHYKK